MFQQKNVSYWVTRELGLVRRELELLNALTAAETAAGESLLDDDDPAKAGASGPLFEKLSHIRTEINGVEAAISACHGRRLDAIRTARAAEVEALRKTAAGKVCELRSLEAKRDKLLGQITELLGCEFVPAATPKTSALQDEIEKLERAAKQAEAASVPTAGAVDLDGVTSSEQVLLAVANDPSDGPSIKETSGWLAACEDSALASVHAGFGDNPRRVRVVWSDSKIDVKASYIFCGALAKKVDADHIDVESGTFRAGQVNVPSGKGVQSPAEVPTRGGWYRA